MPRVEPTPLPTLTSEVAPSLRGSEVKHVMTTDPTPKPKVVAAGLAGAATTVILFVLAQVGITLPAEVGAAITTVMAFLFGYVTSER